MKKVYDDYLNGNIKLNRKQKIAIICLLIVITGAIGWIYEFIFYYFNGGMKTFYMQGGNFFPWINIYAIGSLIIIFFTRKFKKSPLKVFLISILSTGILEYFSGLIIYKLFDGLRLWDYNKEILNFMNIGGFVCFRSVFFFGISGLLLMYVIVPICIYIATKLNIKLLLIISISLFLLIMLDELYNLIIARLFKLPSAVEIYKSLGFKYVTFN